MVKMVTLKNLCDSRILEFCDGTKPSKSFILYMCLSFFLSFICFYIIYDYWDLLVHLFIIIIFQLLFISDQWLYMYELSFKSLSIIVLFFFSFRTIIIYKLLIYIFFSLFIHLTYIYLRYSISSINFRAKKNSIYYNFCFNWKWWLIVMH